MDPQILVACIGNISLGDDGFGVEAARALSATDMPSGVTVVDYGVRGSDLAHALLDPWQSVVLVDAVSRGKRPGTIYLMQAADTAGTSVEMTRLDTHSMDTAQVLNLARSLGEVHAKVFIVGCEPQDFGDKLRGRTGLSAAVEAAVPEAASMVREMVLRLQQTAATEHSRLDHRMPGAA